MDITCCSPEKDTVICDDWFTLDRTRVTWVRKRLERFSSKRRMQVSLSRANRNEASRLGKHEWHETTLIYRRKENSERDDHRQYSVFMANRGSGHLTEYGYRWEIESRDRSIERFMTATTSKNFGRRFFHVAFACLLYSIRRAVGRSGRLAEHVRERPQGGTERSAL